MSNARNLANLLGTKTKVKDVDVDGTELILDSDGDSSITADTDDQIDFKTGGSDRLIIEADGDVKIGTTSDPSHGTADNHVLAISGKQNNGSGVLAFIDTAGNSDALLIGDSGNLTINVDSGNATADSSLQIRVDNTERVRVHSGGVVSFNNGIELGSGLDATAANTLDDYEEGTFTPSADFPTSPSAGASTGEGVYTKVGRLVTVHIRLVNINVTGAVGDIQITGLPFTSLLDSGAGAVTLYTGVARLSQVNVSSDCYCVTSEMIDNVATMRIMEFEDNGEIDILNNANFSHNNSDIHLMMSYPTQ